MEVSQNGGTTKASIFIELCIINHSFLGIHILEPHIKIFADCQSEPKTKNGGSKFGGHRLGHLQVQFQATPGLHVGLLKRSGHNRKAQKNNL